MIDRQKVLMFVTKNRQETTLLLPDRGLAAFLSLRQTLFRVMIPVLTNSVAGTGNFPSTL